MGMTWKHKVLGVCIGVVMVSALAMASGANWLDELLCWLF
jgi:hypothetical protein